MTEQELRDKIIGIVSDVSITGIKIREILGGEAATNSIAEALISAEIGDVGEWKHRAEVAEKELLVYKEVAGAMLCEIECSNEGYCPEFYKDLECKNCTKKKIYGNSAATSPCLFDKYIQQAEKELREERKDD